MIGRVKRLRTFRWLRVSVAAVVVGATLTVAPAMPSAHAYDSNSCMRDFRAEVDKFRVLAGETDFGDDLHLQGMPQGTAVACWSPGGRSVQWIGKVFWDSYNAGCARAVVLVYRVNDPVAWSYQQSTVCSTGGLQSKYVEGSLFGSTPDLSRVVVELYRKRQGETTYTLSGRNTVRFGTRT